MRYGMAINKNRCVACHACTVACLQKNGNAPGNFFSKVNINEIGKYPGVQLEYVPVLCNQCSVPKCVGVCMTGASQLLENGIIVIDQELCEGCGACREACPYGARIAIVKSPWFPGKEPTALETKLDSLQKDGKTGKCNFCLDLLEAGGEPACVHTCVGQARTFGDLEDPNSELSKVVKANGAVGLLFAEGTEPNVFYY